MVSDDKSKAHLYFNSAMETGYNKMFIEISPVPPRKIYPQNIPGSVEELKGRYDNNGFIDDGGKKVPVWGKAWFFCLPKSKPLKSNQK